MSAYEVWMKVHIEDDEDHLMHFIPSTLRDKLRNTKIVIDEINVIKESEPDT